MISGQLALLQEPSEKPLESQYDQTGRALKVEESQSYLDDLVIQSGLVAGDVPKQTERVLLDGYEIETETRTVSKRVASEWVADVDGNGWILAERTHASDHEHDPDWPFSAFQHLARAEIVPVRLKPWEFVRRQRDAGRDWTVKMATREHNLDDVSIDWGTAIKDDAVNADVGVALTTHWEGVFVELVIYASGYLAIWDPSEMKPELLGRFIHEEIVPIATYDDEAEIEEKQHARQTSLEGEGGEAEPEDERLRADGGSKYVNPTGDGYLGIYRHTVHPCTIGINHVDHIDWQPGDKVQSVRTSGGVILTREPGDRETINTHTVSKDDRQGLRVNIYRESVDHLGVSGGGDIRVYEGDSNELLLTPAHDDVRLKEGRR